MEDQKGQEDQEIQQSAEATENRRSWNYEFDPDSSTYSIILLLVIVLCIAVGIGFAYWKGNSNMDAPVSKSCGLKSLIEDFFRKFHN